MSNGRKRKTYAALVLAGVGAGLLLVWAPAAVAVSFAGAYLGVLGQVSLNIPLTRAVTILAVLGHGAIVAAASGIPLLGVAAAVGLAPVTLISSTLVGRFGYHTTRGALVAPPALLALTAAAWPVGWWGLAVLPSLLASLPVAADVVAQSRRRRAFARPRWGVRIGEVVPDFRLPSRDGGEFHLAAERGRFVMVMFIRSDWCPVCHVQLRMFQKQSSRLAEKNVRVVAIGTASGEGAIELTKLIGMDYAFLIDEGCRVAALFDAVQPDRPPGEEIPLPASFLIDPDGILRHSSRPDSIGSLDGPGRILEVLDAEHAKRQAVHAA